MASDPGSGRPPLQARVVSSPACAINNLLPVSDHSEPPHVHSNEEVCESIAKLNETERESETSAGERLPLDLHKCSADANVLFYVVELGFRVACMLPDATAMVRICLW